MFDVINMYQLRILIVFSVVCLFISVFVLTIKFQSREKKQAIFAIELLCAIMLASSAVSFYFRGIPGQMSYIILRVSTCISFTLVSVILYFYNLYLTTIYMGRGKFTKLPKILLIGFILPCVDASINIVAGFTGMYYTFDANNCLHEGVVYPLSYVIPLCIMLGNFIFALKNRHMLSKVILTSLIFYSALLLVAGIVQRFFPQISFVGICAFIDVTAIFWFSLIDQNDELLKATNTDILGIPNSYGYLYEVDRVIATSDITKYVAFYFDIVRMNRINTTYGKERGDEAIAKYAKYILDHMEKDEILGRLGGNYFVALIKERNCDVFLEMLKDVPVELKIDDHTERIHIAAVAGGYRCKKKKMRASQILSNCAIAVNYAKNVAKVPVVFLDEDLEKALQKSRELEDAIQYGLRKKEFIPYYQPKVDAEKGMLCGAEALVRWRHNGELVSPGVFIPNCERSGKIGELDFFMIEKVCEDIAEWIKEGLNPVVVSVNLSRRNLGNPNLVEDILKIVDSKGLDHKYIQIEITETIDEFPFEYLKEVVDSLRRHGFTVALDDFGTGSSSIKVLKDIEFDELKIDKNFIDYETDKEKKLLSYIISMAKLLGIETIAEGVEEEDRLSVLHDMGCHRIQGFIFDKPMPREEFEKRLKNKGY